MARNRRTGMSNSDTITEGSGNVFADLCMPDAAAELVKAQLTFQIAKRIKALGLTQTAATAVLVHRRQLLDLARTAEDLPVHDEAGIGSMPPLMGKTEVSCALHAPWMSPELTDAITW